MTSVSAPWPVASLPARRSRTDTSPTASIPAVIACTANSSSWPSACTRGAVAGGGLAGAAEPHGHLADRVHSRGDRLHGELLELAFDLHQGVDRPVRGVDGPVADGDRLSALAVGEEHPHRGGGPQVGAAADLE